MKQTRKVPGVVPRDAESVRARILDAAQREFMRAGYDSANTNIMARNGVSKATIFRHYPTKRVLFEAVVARVAAHWQARVNANDITDTEPRVWLCKFGLRALRWILSDEALFVGRMAIAKGPNHDEIRRIWLDHANEPVTALLVERFYEWQAAGKISAGDPRRRAVMFFDLILAGRVSRALYGSVESSHLVALKSHVADSVGLFLYGCVTRERDPAKTSSLRRRRQGVGK